MDVHTDEQTQIRKTLAKSEANICIYRHMC